MTGFQWILEIIDKTSKPAKQATGSLDDYEKELKKVDDQIKKLKANTIGFANVQKAKKELRDLKKELTPSKESGLLGAVKDIRNLEAVRAVGEGLGLAMEAGRKVVEVVGEIGAKFIEATGQEQRFRIASGVLFGEQDKEVRDYIDHIAGATELTDDELKSMVLQLKRAGFEADELQNALPAALDIGGFLGGGVANIQAATDALEHMRLTGEANKRQLVALGLSERQVLEQLKKDTGLSVDELKKKMADGKLNPRTLLRAVYEQTAAREGGLLGTTAEKLGDTVEAKLKKLKNLPDQFFQNLVTSKGFDSFSNFLTKLVGELSPESPFGQEVMAGLESIGDTIADTLGVKGGDAVETTKNLIREAVGAAREMVPVMADVAREVADITKGALELIHAYHELKGDADYIKPGGESDKAQFRAGMYAQTGIDPLDLPNASSPDWKLQKYGVTRDQVKSGAAQFIPGVTAPAAQLPGAFNSGPNKMWEPDLSYPSSPAIASQSSRVQPGSGMRVNNSAKVEITINAGNGANADEIADAVGTTLPGAMQQGMERMAVSSGAL
jgi:tape measure domain-containing protein